MLNLPKFSEIKFFKLITHFVFIIVALTLLTLLSKDLVGLVLGHPIEKDVNYVTTPLFLIWLLFALQKDKYKKQSSNY